MRTLRCLIIAGLWTMLALPAFQTITRFRPELPLHGVEHASPQRLPALSFRGFTSERFQKELERWMDAHIGFRSKMVRTDNQLNYAVFGEISSSYGSKLVLGTDGSLIEKLYIDLANGRMRADASRVRKLAKRISHLSKHLRRWQIPLIVLLTPSKVSVSPEIVPQHFRGPDFSPGGEVYDQLKRLLTERHVHVVDGREVALRLKREGKHPVFPKSGTHWSIYTACFIVADLVDTLSRAAHRSYRLPACEPPVYADQPLPFDRDLADLANVRETSAFFEKLPYPPPVQAERQQLKLLFVGGSFLWSVFHIFETQSLYSERTMLYYFKRRFDFPSGNEAPVRRKATDWKSEIRRYDAVVIEINEANIRDAGGGFIGEAFQHVSAGEPPLR